MTLHEPRRVPSAADAEGAADRGRRNAWNEFVPFLGYDVEIRRVRSATNAEQAAPKFQCLVARGLDPTGTGRGRWTMRRKSGIDAFAIPFGDRCPGAETC